jgi:hypothetical protein
VALKNQQLMLNLKPLREGGRGLACHISLFTADLKNAVSTKFLNFNNGSTCFSYILPLPQGWELEAGIQYRNEPVLPVPVQSYL